MFFSFLGSGISHTNTVLWQDVAVFKIDSMFVGPDVKTIRMLFVKFAPTGSVAVDRKGNVGPNQTVVNPENAAKVSGIVQQNPGKSIRWIASETSLKYTSTQKNIKN